MTNGSAGHRTTLEVVEFCAVECMLQHSGEESVAWMVNAWEWARNQRGRHHRLRPGVADVLMLGRMVEPKKNSRGWREQNVFIRDNPDARLTDWRAVPTSIEGLVSNGDTLSAAHWFKLYEEIHPFIDGNGRTGQILYNWLIGTLGSKPQWAPDPFGDPRRTRGHGA